MASRNLIDFEKAIEYMDPMQVTDYLHKTLDFLKRNNNELYFPSISSYVEAFLVNLVSDTRNLTSASFKNENRKLASEIIEMLEMSRDVFRWTHSYENGNLLVYKKIFSNKMKLKPKPSSIAHRLLQAQTQSTSQSPTTEPIDQLPDIPATSTSFKLRFLSKTLRFIKDETGFTLYYKEMPLDLAEYIYNLIKYRDKDVGFGYKSLYASLWEAMEEYGVDYKFDVMLEETSRDTAVLKLEKVPKHNKSKRDKTKKEIPEIMNNVKGQKEENTKNKSPKSKQDKRNQTMDQCLNITSPTFPHLELLSNINERFFADVVVALTEFADDEARASIVFQQLAEEEIVFVKRVKMLAESSKVREMFPPKYRDLLCRLDYSIKEVLQTCKITTTVNDEDRSITLKKTPRIAAPQPVTQQSIATGARSKSLVSSKTRDRSISKDRLIQFQKGGKLPATIDVEMTIDEPTTDKQLQERGRTKRTAKLLEDLSTPVESDRGMRMMLLMGWNGGALGARGDGIMEPVMPNIDQPTRGGLGHVPPPKPQKANPRRALHFRLTLLHSIYDLLLHDDMQKEIQFKEPLVGKETNFVQNSLKCLNKRRHLSLTEQENELVSLVVRELAGKPEVKVRHEFSSDFKTVILHKLITNDPVKMPTNQPVKMPKPKPAKQPQVVTITDDDVDVLVTIDDVKSVTPHVDLGIGVASNQKPAKQPQVVTITDDDVDVLVTIDDVESVTPHVDLGIGVACNQKAIRRRAARLLVLAKFAEVLHWDWGCQSRIVFKFTFTLPKKLKLFIRSVIDSLNNGGRHYDLFGWESQVYEDIRAMVPGSMLSWEAMTGSTFILRKTPLISEDFLPNAGGNLPNNNNDIKTDNRNQIINVNDCTEIGNQSINVFENNDFGSKLSIEDEISNIADDISDIELNNDLVQAIKNTGNLNDIKNIDLFIKDDPLTFNAGERNVANTSIQGRERISVTIKNNTTKYITVKNVNQINAEIDSFNSIQKEMDEAEVEIIECDIEEPGRIVPEVNITEFDIEKPSERIEKAEVNITGFDIEKPSERIEMNITGFDIEKPSERIEIPELNVTEFDIEKRPERIEKAEVNITQFDTQEPSERIEMAEMNVTKFDIEKPSERIEIPELNVTEFDIENPSERIEIPDLNVTEFDIQEPSERIQTAEVNITGFDIEKPSERIEIPELNITGFDIEKPSERIEIPEMNVTKFDIEKPSERIEIPELNVTEFDIENPSERIEIEVQITEFDNVESSVKEADVSIINKGTDKEVTEGAKIIVRDTTVLSDWDRDIDDIELTILNVDSDCVVKEENTECDLETTFHETDLEIIKDEKDESLHSKRSHSSSVCSQELDPKKVKISCETDEYIVRITPKNRDEEMTEDLVKQVQTLMSNELDKSGGFLALLKCHGVQNGGLIYSCHDEDDVAWLKKVISVANLDVEIVPCDLCSEKKTRELLIRINSYIPVDVKKIFRKFEIYNLGLDTKYWRVSHKHTEPTFVMFIVTVDEKSFNYICDEKFSLYCGIDKAQCSIIN